MTDEPDADSSEIFFRVSLKLQKSNGEIAQPLPVIWKELADL